MKHLITLIFFRNATLSLCAGFFPPELLPHASPYVAREMSFAVSGALANRGLTTIRLARVSGIAHLSLPVNRSGSTKLGKWKTHFLIRYDVFDEEQR